MEKSDGALHPGRERPRTRIDGFWLRVSSIKDDPDACPEWTGYRMKSGYGQLTFGGVQITAHRLAWILTHGPIPEGKGVLHHCDNPACVAHLFLGTQADNDKDRDRKDRVSHGERHYSAVLTENGVRSIRELLARGTRIANIANAYGVSRAAIYAIKNGRVWKRTPIDQSLHPDAWPESKYRSKLTEDAVRAIRQRLFGGDKLADVAREFGVTISSVADIKHGRSWRNVR